MHGEVTRLCKFIVYSLERIEIFEDIILNENERKEERSKLVSVEKEKFS
jgi:hypothetical protein